MLLTIFLTWVISGIVAMLASMFTIDGWKHTLDAFNIEELPSTLLVLAFGAVFGYILVLYYMFILHDYFNNKF